MPKTSKFAETLYNAEWLREEYKTKNAPQIADEIGCTRGAVLDNLRKHKIPIEPGKHARREGSHAPRPRTRFVTTLHNEAWLREHYVEGGMSASQIAHLAGSSIPAALRALRVAGIEVRTIGEQLRGKPNPSKRKRSTIEVTLRARARRKTPPGPCVVCGKDGRDVNHRDRDPLNESVENLERLCKKCHCMQHAEEERIMIDMLKESGVSYISIHERARASLLAKRAT